MKIEYRTPAGSGAYTVLADEGAVGGTSDRISGYQPAFKKRPLVVTMFLAESPSVSDMGNAEWSLRFAVDRVHADADAAATFISAHAAALGGVVDTFDLKITIGAVVFLASKCALGEFTPSPQSDKSTVIVYGWTPTTYAVSA